MLPCESSATYWHLKRMSPSASPPWIGCLRDSISPRKKTFHASEKESDRVQAKRVEFWNLVHLILATNLIFIDEYGVNLALTRLNARSEKGQRAHGKRPNKRGENVSLIAALGLKGIVAQVAIGGSVDGITFEAFIANRLVPNLWPGAYVIMDNCRVTPERTIGACSAAIANTGLGVNPDRIINLSLLEIGLSSLNRV